MTFFFLQAPSPDSCFSSHLPHSSSLSLPPLATTSAHSLQSCPEETLRQYFPSEADLFKGGISYFVASEQILPHVEISSMYIKTC